MKSKGQADREETSREFGSRPPSSRNSRGREMTSPQRTGRREGLDKERARLSAGDPDVTQQGIETGEETPGGSTPTPDQDRVDEIGAAVGVTYQDNEPLAFGEKYAHRDDERWEDDPASSEDYEERQAFLESDSSAAKKPVRGRTPSNGSEASQDA
ncbi:MAG TPA: DUF6335 family protein [Nitrospiraceae bacterium]|nr:DUF6335 family protein [Nitrospiraceae bacterium]